MTQRDDRAGLDHALRRARLSAFPPGEYVGQESFMRASEILRLAVGAGVAPGVSVLDLCCGVAGPGRFLASTLGCSYLGVDASASAVEIARQRAVGLPCSFRVGRVPPVPCGPFDVVIMLETMLAFRDKDELVRDVCAQLPVGGRFAFTLEAGAPLSSGERADMPEADSVWPVPVEEMASSLARAGLLVRRQEDVSTDHLDVVESLVTAFEAHRQEITAGIGRPELDRLLTAHRLWGDWLRSGRVRKVAFVSERAEGPA